MLNLIAKVVSLNGGWEDEEKKFKSLNLEIGQRLEVTNVDMGSWCTYIKVVGYEESLNSIFFEFFDAITDEPVDIYNDKRFFNRFLTVK